MHTDVRRNGIMNSRIFVSGWGPRVDLIGAFAGQTQGLAMSLAMFRPRLAPVLCDFGGRFMTSPRFMMCASCVSTH